WSSTRSRRYRGSPALATSPTRTRRWPSRTRRAGRAWRSPKPVAVASSLALRGRREPQGVRSRTTNSTAASAAKAVPRSHVVANKWSHSRSADGEWLPWLKHVKFSSEAAEDYMRVASSREILQARPCQKIRGSWHARQDRLQCFVAGGLAPEFITRRKFTTR